MTKRNNYYTTRRRNGTEDEITLHSPTGRAMLCVAFWDAEYDNDPAKLNADQLKADAERIVTALNANRRTRGVRKLLEAIKPLKARLATLTATIVPYDLFDDELLDKALRHHEQLSGVQFVLTQIAGAKGARVNDAAIEALRKVVEEAKAFLARPGIPVLVPDPGEVDSLQSGTLAYGN